MPLLGPLEYVRMYYVNELLIFKYAYFCKLFIIIPRGTQNMIHFSSNMLLLLIFCVIFIHFRETLKHLKRLVKSFYETFPVVHLLNTEVLSNFWRKNEIKFVWRLGFDVEARTLSKKLPILTNEIISWILRSLNNEYNFKVLFSIR